MRFSYLPTVLLAGFLSACTSSSTSNVLDISSPSPSITNSIVSGPPPIPSGSLGLAAAAPTFEPSEFVENNVSEPKAEVEQVAMIIAEPVKKQTKERTTQRYTKSKVYSQRFKDAKPINFGSASPKKFAIHGVDVSRWQGDINWSKLRKQGANFVFIKATDGGDHLDPMFKQNWDDAEKAGIARGAYHFFYWCRVGDQQADWFIRNVPKVKGALPPVIDVEWNNESRSCRKRPSRETILKKMKIFMEKVEAHYGQRPIIYTAPDFYEDNLQGEFKDYPFWLRSVAAHPKKVYPNRDWVFWQYSGTGLSAGHPTHIDLNVFNGSEAVWHKWLGKNLH